MEKRMGHLRSWDDSPTFTDQEVDLFMIFFKENWDPVWVGLSL